MRKQTVYCTSATRTVMIHIHSLDVVHLEGQHMLAIDFIYLAIGEGTALGCLRLAAEVSDQIRLLRDGEIFISLPGEHTDALPLQRCMEHQVGTGDGG